MLIALSFLLSACSFSYQFLFVRLLSYSLQNEVLVQSLALGVFLLCIGIAMYFAPRFVGKGEERVQLFWVEVLLSCVGASLAVLVQISDILFILFQDFHWILAGEGKILGYLWIPAVLGLLTGLELPLLYRIQGQKNFLALLAANYFGGIFGAVFFSLLLFPLADFGWVSVFLGFLNLCVAVVIKIPTRIYTRLGLVGAGLFCFLLLQVFPKVEETHAKTFVMQFRVQRLADFSNWLHAMDGFKSIERYKSAFQTIDLVPDGFVRANPTGGDFHLYMNGQLQFSRDSVLGYHESMVFGSLNLGGFLPDRALVLGGGDGLLVTQLLKAGVKEIVLVEIDPKVVELAKTHPTLVELNRNSLQDPRVKIEVADAFTYLVSHQQKWDAIFIDFPFPTNYELLKLYSVEFYERVKNNLSVRGFFTFDAPVWVQKSVLEEEARPYPQEVLWQTLLTAGLKNVEIFGPKEPFFFVSNAQEKVEFHYEKLPAEISGKTQYNLVLLQDMHGDLREVKANRLLRPERIRW
jgi:spermidine synthase